MSSTLFIQQEGFTRYPSVYPNTIRNVIEQRTPSLSTVKVKEGEDVEGVLVEAGLTPQERIMSLSKEGHKYIRYSKCVDADGNVCLIEHDGYGHIVGENVIADLYEEQDASLAISSLKNHVCDMSKKHGCMLSIGSNAGYYIASFSGEVKKEAFYAKIKHKCQEGQLCLSGSAVEADIKVDSVIVVPVFKFSELKSHKENIMKKLIEMTFYILCVMNRLAEEKNKEFQCSLEHIVEKWKKFSCVRDAYVRKLHDKLRKLECLLKEIECNKSLMDCHKDKYHDLKKKYKHLISDYAKFNAIILSSHKLVGLAKEIDGIISDNICKLEALDKCC